MTCAVVSNRAQQRSGADDDVQVQEQRSSDVLFLLARQLLAVRSIFIVSVIVGSGFFMELCGCATVRDESCSRAAEHGAVDPRPVQLA